jgi:hypothetical protein
MESKNFNFPVLNDGFGHKTSKAGSSNCTCQVVKDADSEIVVLSPQLIQLEKNDRLLLMDGFHVMPLLIHQGKEFIKDYLNFCRKIQKRKLY